MNPRQLLTILLVAFVCFLGCSASVRRRRAHIDLLPAANTHNYGHGRVQMKVYRGPSEGHEHFAPHGFWVKQPADNHYHRH